MEGIGIDMIEVERIADKIRKNSGFKELIFSDQEILYCESKANRFEHYAARFAAKEAFFKALGTGWFEGSSFKEIEVIHNPQGQPQISLAGNTALLVEKMGIQSIAVSLTHIQLTASAIVMIKKYDPL